MLWESNSILMTKNIKFTSASSICVSHENDFTNAICMAEHAFPLKFKQLICVNRVFESLMANPLDSTRSYEKSSEKNAMPDIVLWNVRWKKVIIFQWTYWIITIWAYCCNIAIASISKQFSSTFFVKLLAAFPETP